MAEPEVPKKNIAFSNEDEQVEIEWNKNDPKKNKDQANAPRQSQKTRSSFVSTNAEGEARSTFYFCQHTFKTAEHRELFWKIHAINMQDDWDGLHYELYLEDKYAEHGFFLHTMAATKVDNYYTVIELDTGHIDKDLIKFLDEPKNAMQLQHPDKHPELHWAIPKDVGYSGWTHNLWMSMNDTETGNPMCTAPFTRQFGHGWGVIDKDLTRKSGFNTTAGETWKANKPLGVGCKSYIAHKMFKSEYHRDLYFTVYMQELAKDPNRGANYLGLCIQHGFYFHNVIPSTWGGGMVMNCLFEVDKDKTTQDLVEYLEGPYGPDRHGGLTEKCQNIVVEEIDQEKTPHAFDQYAGHFG